MAGHVNLTEGEVVGGRFLVGAKLGQGGFGSVYRAFGQHTGERYALKVEREDRNVLLRELEALSVVGGKGRVGPAPKEWFKLGNNSVLAMELKGETMRGVNGSLASVGVLMSLVLTLLGRLHHNGFVHRDIKATNIVYGDPEDPEDAHKIYLIDFGLSGMFRGPKGAHVPKREGVRPKGTFQYLSVNSHKLVLQSRRDDLESLAYMAGRLLKGRLPWAFTRKKRPKHPEAARIKERRTRHIFSRCPRVFADFLEYVRGLAYDEEPDYVFWRDAFESLSLQDDPDNERLRKCRKDVWAPPPPLRPRPRPHPRTSSLPPRIQKSSL